MHRHLNHKKYLTQSIKWLNLLKCKGNVNIYKLTDGGGGRAGCDGGEIGVKATTPSRIFEIVKSTDLVRPKI